MAGHDSLSSRLYRGELSIDFIGRRRLWYAISVVIVLLALTGLFTRGLNTSVEFRGGNDFRVEVPATTSIGVEQVRSAVSDLGIKEASNPTVSTLSGTGTTIRVTTAITSPTDTDRIQTAIAKTAGVQEDAVGVSSIGASWGRDISRTAITSLVVFLVLVMVYLAIAFEWRMGVAAIVSLVHDLVITVGIYALVGFEVSPATVIGVLTVLGYSLYDSVVVFDKVRENTRNIKSRSDTTYSLAANLALNQTLVRSINTTVIALLPIVAILVIGTLVLGPGVLQDLSLALAIGLAAGAYSSVFLATPLLAQLRERDPAMAAVRARYAAYLATRKDPATPDAPGTDAELTASRS